MSARVHAHRPPHGRIRPRLAALSAVDGYVPTSAHAPCTASLWGSIAAMPSPAWASRMATVCDSPPLVVWCAEVAPSGLNRPDTGAGGLSQNAKLLNGSGSVRNILDRRPTAAGLHSRIRPAVAKRLADAPPR